jgi:hypothetical protein
VHEAVLGEQVLMRREVEPDMERRPQLAGTVAERNQLDIADVHQREASEIRRRESGPRSGDLIPRVNGRRTCERPA